MILLVLCSHALAQETRVQFERIDGAESFSNVGIDAIAQDAQGFMWFGSLGDGLARYDGYEFKVFRHDQDDPRSLSNNEVNAIDFAPDGTMWVATASGLNEFDAGTETFTRYLPDAANPESISGSYIEASVVEADGTLWVGPGGGLDRRAPGESGFRHYTLMPENEEDESFEGIGPNRAFTLLLDSENTLWVGTLGGGLLRYNRGTDTFTRFRHDPEDSNSVSNDSIRDVYEDRAGTLWIATDAGLSRMDRTSNTFRNYGPDENDPSSLKGNWVGNLLEDSLGNFWVSADVLGVSLFDRESETFSHYTHDAADPRSLGPGRLWTIFEDNRGIVWLGADSINRVLPTVHAFELFRNPAESVRMADSAPDRMLQTQNGQLWLNTPEGVDRLDLDTAEWQRFALVPEDPANGLNEAMAMHEDRDGTLWVAYPQSVSRVNIETGQHASLDHPSKPFCVYVDKANRLWLCQPFYGFSEYNSETGEQVQIFDSDSENETSISSTFAYFANEDSAGRFWIGTYGGLNLFDPDTGTFKRYSPIEGDTNSISSDDVRSYFEDPSGNVWFGTSYGLNRYHPETDNFTRYLNGNGTQSNRVQGIVAGEQNHLWINHDGGLAKFDPATGDFYNITARDGLPLNIGHSIVRDSRDGLIYLATPEGVVRFNPARLDVGDAVPAVAFTDFRLFNKSVPIQTANAASPLHSAINLASRLTLGHEDALLSFSFAALDYSDPASHSYAYRLQGFDEDWIETDATRRTATYTALPPGDYEFQVRASIGGQNRALSGATLGLTILPPWWRTTFAYIAYVIVALSLVFTLLQLRTRSLRFRSAELEALVAERTDNLKSKTQTIEDQAIHLQQLIDAKDQYFTRVSHEFRTPLTIILGPIERLLSRNVDYEARRYLSTVQRNANRLLRLVDQLLGLSRIDAGKGEASAPHAVQPTIRYIVASMDSLAAEKNISVSADEVDDVWVNASADALEEIVINLLSNALKYTPAGGNVWVRARLDGQTVCITVEDTGPGIPVEQQNNVFKRFYRLDDLAETAPGSGLGLALVKEMVIANDGAIELDNTVDIGTRIRVSLPAADRPAEFRRQVDASIDNRMATEIEMALPAQSPPRTISINDDLLPNLLIIEDNADLCQHLQSVFANSLHCDFAHDGQSGIDMAVESIPDAIICDVMLPRINGFEVTRQLKRDDRTCHIPIIMLTARVDEESRIEGFKTLADDYLAKPFSEAELRQRIDTLLAVREILRDRFSKEIDRDGLEAFKASLTEHDRRFIDRVEQVLEREYAESGFSTAQFANGIAMSERQLQRKLKAIMNYSPREYLRNFRLRKAMKLLQSGSSVADAAYSVGFTSLSYFAKCFKARYGLTPSQVFDRGQDAVSTPD